MTAVPARRGRIRRPISLHSGSIVTRALLAAIVAVALAMPAAAQDAALRGRVADPDGRPVAGATVTATRAGSSRTATSDDDGGYAFDRLAPGAWQVGATAPGLASPWQTIEVAPGRGARADFTLGLRAVAESLVVSAALVDQPLSRTPDSVTVIDGADLEARQVTTLAGALQLVPGFAVARSGGPGTLTSLFPRGGESDYTLVLVDGVRANSFGGGLDLSQVPLDQVDRIEVVRSPQSALYGADAIGGVIQVITRHGGPPSANARLEAGSRQTRRAAAGTAGELGDWRWQAAGDWTEDAGYTGPAPANGEPVGNDDAREAQASAGLGWRGTGGTDVQATVRYVDTDRGAPGPYGSDPAGRFFGVDRVSRGETARRSGSVRVVRPWFGPASRVRQRLDVDLSDYDLTFTSPYGVSLSGTRRLHARAQTDVAAGAALGVSAGAEWIGERATSTYITGAGGELPVERGVLGLFGEARWTGHPRATVTAGLRAERIHRDRLAGDPYAFTPRPDFAADTIVSVNPKLAVSWIVSPRTPADGARAWTRVRASAGTGIRPPDAFEIAYTDNPSLRPERSRSVEAGVTETLAGGALALEATAFVNTYDDLIISVGRLSATSRFQTDNISNARARGVELSGWWRARAGLQVRAAYTWLDTEVLAVDGAPGQAPAPYAVGDPLLRRPRHMATLDATWTGRRLTLFTTVTARGETLDAEPAFGPTGGLYLNPGHAVADLGGSVRLGRGVEAYGRLLNLFDRGYEEVLGYPAPGRTAFVGVRVAAGR
ncbi:MAG: TonB-dependent receptor [Vicinamibacterales bacterium]